MIFFYLCFFFPHIFFCRQEISSKVRDFFSSPRQKKGKKERETKKKKIKKLSNQKHWKKEGGWGKTGSQKEKMAGHPIGAQPLRG